MKHFDNGDGSEFCSGRPGWSNRKTEDRAAVTCKNCLKILNRLLKEQAPVRITDTLDDAERNHERPPEIDPQTGFDR